MDHSNTFAWLIAIYFFTVYLSWMLLSNVPRKWIMHSDHADLYSLYTKSIPPWNLLNIYGRTLDVFFWAGGGIGLALLVVLAFN